MLTVSPLLYTHKWISQNGKYELVIDIPKNTRELIEMKEMEPSNDPFSGMMMSDLLNKRSAHFHERLIAITYDHYLKNKEMV
jgi:hypothetical protein